MSSLEETLRQTGDRLQGLHLPSRPGAARYLAEAAGERAGLPLEMTFDPDPHKHRKNRIMCKVILGTPPLTVECIYFLQWIESRRLYWRDICMLLADNIAGRCSQYRSEGLQNQLGALINAYMTQPTHMPSSVTALEGSFHFFSQPEADTTSFSEESRHNC